MSLETGLLAPFKEFTLMLNKKEYETLLDSGYTTVKFPESLRNDIESEIVDICNELANHNKPSYGSLSSAQEYILDLDDQTFVKQFTKARRTLKEPLAQKVLKWMQSEFDGFFDYDQLYINSVSEPEAAQFSHLNTDQISIYWRVVRPNKDTDVAGAHQDSTFWRIAHNMNYNPKCPFEYKQRWKIWLPLFGSNKHNSLQVLPESHRVEVPDGIIQSEIGERPVIDKTWLEERKSEFRTPVSAEDCECVLFHDDLVHQGPVNKFDKVRFSVEWTILAG